MFERYTERGRRVIFFARYEASNFGSTAIETEHLLLGLIREDKNLTQRFLRDSSSIESIRKEIEGRTTIREKISTSIDLPLSNECKRILAYANEESDRLNHRHIGTEHILLGILREVKCVAAEILHERGLRADAIREDLARSAPDRLSSEIDLVPADRPSIHALVDQLPESALGRAKWMLSQMMLQATMPVPMHGGMFGHIASRMARLRRGTEGAIREGRASSTREEDGTTVVETHQFLKGHQISTTERFRMSEDGKTLSYSQEVVGPKPEQQHKQAMEFDVS